MSNDLNCTYADNASARSVTIHLTEVEYQRLCERAGEIQLEPAAAARLWVKMFLVD